MSLSFNRLNPIYLASGSADKKVKIWDINEEKCVNTFSFHTDKVQVVQWNPRKEDVLLSAGFDSVAYIYSSKDNSKIQTKIRKNLEKAKWHSGKDNYVNFTFEDGFIQVFDTRNFSKPVLEFKAHDKACTSITACPNQ
jgi:periodic tryptophan protein 1